MNVVVGAPLDTPLAPAHLRGRGLVKTEEGRALVDKWHGKYIEALVELWETHKHNLPEEARGEHLLLQLKEGVQDRSKG